MKKQYIINGVIHDLERENNGEFSHNATNEKTGKSVKRKFNVVEYLAKESFEGICDWFEFLMNTNEFDVKEEVKVETKEVEKPVKKKPIVKSSKTVKK